MGAGLAEVVVAEDNEADYVLLDRACQSAGWTCPRRWVKDGRELMDYLLRGDRLPQRAPNPRLVLLDLDMPRKSGLEALEEMRSIPRLKTIPVVILTGTRSRGAISAAYLLGANSCVRKPGDHETLVEVARAIKKFWLETSLPPTGEEVIAPRVVQPDEWRAGEAFLSAGVRDRRVGDRRQVPDRRNHLRAGRSQELAGQHH